MSEMEFPTEWPPGATEESARRCNCEWCEALLERLEEHRAGLSADGQHAALTAFSEDAGEVARDD